MTTIRPELLDELLQGATTQEAIFGFGPAGVLKRLTGAIVERALAAELDVHLRQEQEEVRSGNRRNGKSSKTLQSEQGPVPIAVPRDRLGTFEPQLIKKHQTRIPGLDEKILALYARGVSTREIEQHLEELYGTEVSPSLVSAVTEAVCEELNEWQNRPLDGVYPVIWLDALVIKVRDQGLVRNKAAHLAVGLTLEGRKEVLGLWFETNEGAKFWLRVLTELRNRGVKDVLFACCDGLKGFPEAIEAAFPQATVQTCMSIRCATRWCSSPGRIASWSPPTCAPSTRRATKRTRRTRCASSSRSGRRSTPRSRRAGAGTGRDSCRFLPSRPRFAR